MAALKLIIIERQLDILTPRSSYALRDIGKVQDISYCLLSIGIGLVEMNVVCFFCFPSHDQNEGKVRDIASYDLKTVLLDNHVESLLPKV